MQKIVQNIEKNLPNFELMIKLKRLWNLNHQIVIWEQLIKYADVRPNMSIIPIQYDQIKVVDDII